MVFRNPDADAEALPHLASERLTHPTRDEGPDRVRNRRITYVVGSLVLTAIVVLAVTDYLGWTRMWGVSSGRVSSTGDGYQLTVRYPDVTRPALASPFQITVEHAGGFDGPVDIAVSTDFLEMWDANAWYPDPSSSHADDEQVVMEFDPPSGDVLVVTFDARIQPSQQSGHDGEVAVLEDDAPVASVRFHTRVLP
jgi:hypothetical protein